MARDVGPVLRALRGLIEVHARALDEDLPGALQPVVAQLARVLDVRAVAINLHRPAWDDFEIVAIHAPPEIVEALHGGHVPRATVERLLDPAFDVGGAFFIPAGSIAEDDLAGVSAVIPRDDRPDRPDRWREDDELVIPIRDPDGELRGFVAVDEPISGIRPGPDEIAVAVAVTEAAAAAVVGAQQALEARRSREALELLFEVSASLTHTSDIDQVLHAVCDAISRALGFERVAVEVVDPTTGALEMRASVGWDDAPPSGALSLDDIADLCQASHEVEGCYLWGADDAMAVVGADRRAYESRRNGSGPLAWDHHWLLVPLVHADGRIGGWIWPDDPVDCLLPTPSRLRILRTFANQALAAVSDAAHVDQLQALARLDGLTGVLNHRAFFEHLDGELQRARKLGDEVTVVLFDLDQFKALNDAEGHPAGDAALRSFSRILERCVRSGDAVGRVGGDEFAVLLVGAEPAAEQSIIERILTTMDEEPPGAGVRASYGTARSRDDGWTAAELIDAADRRLYDDKRQGATPRPRIRLVPDP